jgi:hypothetical protein
MDKKTLQRKVGHLQCLSKLRVKDRLSVVDVCSDECIHAVCESCFNLLEGTIPIQKDKKVRLKSKLMPIRFHIRKLADPKLSVKEKKEILKVPQVGKGIFSLIATTVLPALISALVSK